VRPGVLSFLLLALTAAAAPRPRADDPVFPTALEEIHLTVTVQDEEGRLVTGLRPEDFVVLEEGRPQKVELFGRGVEKGQEEAMALDLGLLMDTSQSMLKELKLSQEAAVRFLDSIPRARDLVTIFFDDDIRISRYDSENQQGLFERIHTLKGGGNTALYDAISVYLSRVRDSTGRKVLVLFTDGEDSRSAVSLQELTRLVRASPVTIYSVAFTGSLSPASSRGLKARAILDQLADVSGGRVFAPRTSRDLPTIYDHILDELKGQYVLGYVSDDPRRDGKFRRIKVEVARKDVRVRHRSGYFAPET
jgi:Ca-activated chloride channel family protein